jgi:hypothetical protein
MQDPPLAVKLAQHGVEHPDLLYYFISFMVYSAVFMDVANRFIYPSSFMDSHV